VLRAGKRAPGATSAVTGPPRSRGSRRLRGIGPKGLGGRVALVAGGAVQRGPRPDHPAAAARSPPAVVDEGEPLAGHPNLGRRFLPHSEQGGGSLSR